MVASVRSVTVSTTQTFLVAPSKVSWHCICEHFYHCVSKELFLIKEFSLSLTCCSLSDIFHSCNHYPPPPTTASTRMGSCMSPELKVSLEEMKITEKECGKLHCSARGQKFRRDLNLQYLPDEELQTNFLEAYWQPEKETAPGASSSFLCYWCGHEEGSLKEMAAHIFHGRVSVAMKKHLCDHDASSILQLLRMMLLVDFHTMKGFITVSSSNEVVWAAHAGYSDIQRHRPVMLTTHLPSFLNSNKPPSGISWDMADTSTHMCPHCVVKFAQPMDLGFHLLAAYWSPRQAANITFCHKDALGTKRGDSMLTTVNSLLFDRMMNLSHGVKYIPIDQLPPQSGRSGPISWIPGVQHAEVQELSREGKICLLLRRTDHELRGYILEQYKTSTEKVRCPCCNILFATRGSMVRHLCRILSKPKKPDDYKTATALSKIKDLQRQFFFSINQDVRVHAMFVTDEVS